MGFLKGLLIFVLNITVFVIAVRFITLFLERIGVFKAMERVFGKRENNSQIHDLNDYEVRDADKSDSENDDNIG
ncbi:MAG: hypothetical protein FWD48_01480 [Oscillospiraceae bacterium]|nr:hypothetical protein [Oscillospiraceae bacterium]